MDFIKTVNALARDYRKDKFDVGSADPNPFAQFEKWFNEAVNSEIMDANAFVLSTADKNGIPSSRVVLLKRYDRQGFVFFTNYESKKGDDLLENPHASMLFYWDVLERQIRIVGKVEKVTEKESDEYFQTRPYMSRIGAWASKQSHVLGSRASLMAEVAKLMAKYPNNVPLPPFWGGYRVMPESFEFWQGRESRLHDRMKYDIDAENKWKIKRLSP
jgi:pyridoxamine 5'-phosphate oxidase